MAAALAGLGMAAPLANPADALVANPADAAVSTPTAGTAVCTITNSAAVGLSGLVVTADGYIAVSDSNYDKSKIRIWYFDHSCRVTHSIGYPTAAYDPEDAALGRDGSLYVGDIGDNGMQRTTVTIWRLAPGSRTPKRYRYAYPDGAHDAEALLLTRDDEPIIVTKEPFVANVYEATARPDPSGHPVPLRKIGTLDVRATTTPNGYGIAGSTVVTGGAQSTDRTKVALRTYADAYEWTVSGGDVVKAITTTAPVVTPLSGEPAGESIAYGPGGTSFYTLSDVESTPMRNTIRRYASAVTVPAPRTSAAAGASPDSASPDSASPDAASPDAASPAAPSARPHAADPKPSGRGFEITAVIVVAMLIAAGVAGLALRRRRQ